MSLIEKAIKKVKIQNLYDHILNLEKIRHPLDSMMDLNKSGEYIEKQFQKYGLKSERQDFHVESFDEPFFNVESYLPSTEDAKASNNCFLITSHYDTVHTSPGADDNASAVAAMLEAARVLKELEYDNNVGFVSFSLEEGSSRILKLVRNAGKKLNVYDKNFRFKSLHVLNSQKILWNTQTTTRSKFGFLDEESWENFSLQVKGNLKKKELQFFEEVNNIYKENYIDDSIGDFALLGSHFYATNAAENKVGLAGVLNLESIGYVSSDPFSQKFPAGFSYDLFNKYKVDAEQKIGDFIAVLPDANSIHLAEEFQRWSENKLIDLPCASLNIPLEFKTIVESLNDLLRSDHAPFWKYGYPALFITDSANFRNPFYHTMGDTIDTLDFEFIKKVCQATIATVISLQNGK